MDNYIDWDDTAKVAGEAQLKPQAATLSQEASTWQGPTKAMQQLYDIDISHRAQPSRPNLEYAQHSHHMAYHGASMPQSRSPPNDIGSHSYHYQHMAPQRSHSQQEYHDAPVAQVSAQQNSNINYPAGYNHPYTYANNGNPYNNLYPANGNPQSTYISSYNPQAYETGPNGANGRYPAQGYAYAAQTGSGMQQQQHTYQQHYAPSQGQAYPNNYQYNQQYQRPEDALARVQQSQVMPKAGMNVSMHQYPGHPQYSNWQTGPGQPVYFGMDARPVAHNKAAAPIAAKPARPASPPRPSEPLAALRYDVSHCLNDYNTSRDLKGCAAALLAIMATCDPVVPVAKEGTPAATDSSSKTGRSSTDLDPKIKQTALLSVVHSEMKGSMIEEVGNNKSIRAKLRTWFVRAHKDNSFIVLKPLILVLNKLLSLSATSLAEVKFGKAIIIVSRKCEDKEIKDLLAPWIAKAEESLVVERQIDAALEEEEKKKATATKQSLANKGTIKPTVKSPPVASETRVKKADGPIQKKPESVAKSNAAFFKKETAPAVKPVVAKPGMAAALASIKARKRSEADNKVSAEADAKISKPAQTAPGATTSTVAKNASTGKSTFSALKLVEGLKRTVSPTVSKDMEPASKKLKQKKRVSWRPDAELEQIQIFESIEPEGGWDSAHTKHEYKDARDLDRREGAILHRGVLPDREEEFIDWCIPRVLDFSHKSLAAVSETRGPKTAGSQTIHSKASEAAEARESSVFLVAYASESEIPWSPSETLAVHDLEVQTASPPKTIPLPEELRNDWRIRQVLGDLAGPAATLPTSDAAQQAPNNNAGPLMPMPLPVMPGAAGSTPDIAAILAGILAAQQNAASAADPGKAASSAPQNTAMPDFSAALPSNNANNANTAPAGAGAGSAMPPPPSMFVDAKLADFLKMAAMSGSNMMDAPPFPLPPMPMPMQMPNVKSQPDTSASHPLPPQFGGLRDVRPWVKFNDNGRYREPCRFIALGKCDKGDACGYLHLDGPGHRM